MSVVAIKIAGTDVTTDVVYKGCEFTSQVNAATGTAKLRIRDNSRTYSFATGASLTLDVDGSRVWTGYVSTVKRVYQFAAQATTPLPGRFLDIEGVDINILFTKRVVFNQTTPATVPGPTFGANTADTAAISSLLGYLDLSGDSLDTSSGITGVATVNQGDPWNGWAGGWKWSDAMNTIIRQPGSIYYIDPDRKFVYCDVDTPTAPYTLSDTPAADSAVGYREMELLYDGSDLDNDHLVWGAGYGSQSIAFQRVSDATSIATHGRWQGADYLLDVYKSSTVTKIANSWVYGSPTNHRGHKDDKVAVIVSTFQGGFRCAQKVNFTSHAYGYSDVLPIRAMRVTFDVPTSPKYELTLSHAIDAPWGFIDQFFPSFSFPTYGMPSIGGIEIPGPNLLTTGPCTCGITDGFAGRTAAAAGDGTAGDTVYGPWWGTADCGLTWGFHNIVPVASSGHQSCTASISGGVAMMDCPLDTNPDFPASPWVRLDGMNVGSNLSALMKVRWTQTYPPLDSNASPYGIITFWNASGTGNFDVGWNFVSSSGWGTGTRPNVTLYGSSPFTSTAWDRDPAAENGAWVWVRVVRDDTAQTLKMTYWLDGTAEPGTPTLSMSTVGMTTWTGPTNLEIDVNPGSGTSGEIGALRFEIAHLEVTGVDACNQSRFDNFNRTVASGWGVSSIGLPWTDSQTGTGGSLSVDGAEGVCLFDTTDNASTEHLGISSGLTQMPDNESWSMRVRFQFEYVPLGTTPDYFTRLTVWPGNFPRCIVTISQSASYGSIEDWDSAGPYVITTWTMNGWYILELSYDATTDLLSSRVYLDGTTPPAWQQVSSAPCGHPTGNTSLGIDIYDNRAMNPSSRPQQRIYVDSIDFDYAGKPCYQNCPTTIFDSYSRTVASGWGTSDTGYAWVQSTTLSGGTASSSVNGSNAVMTATAGSTGTIVSEKVTTTDPPFSYVGGNTVTISTKVKFTDVGTWSTHVPQLAFLLNDGAERFTITPTPGVVGSTYNLGVSNGTYSGGFNLTMSAGRWYLARFQWAEGASPGYLSYLRAKIWADGSTEPDWQVNTLVADANVPTGNLVVSWDVVGSGWTSSVYIDYIAYQNCAPVPVPTTTVPSSGYYCETLVPSGTVLTTSAPYTPGSTEVYANGALQVPGGAYNETDWMTGKITLTFTPLPSDVFRVCYTATSAQGGGVGGIRGPVAQ